ncbi:MAG: hypothetical protein HND48_07670 [Chloroflexi bacterium]|nr:hypothetical protein [Chloroflexota bacterium]
MYRRRAKVVTLSNHPLRAVNDQEGADHDVDQCRREPDAERQRAEWQQRHDRYDPIQRGLRVGQDVQAGQSADHRRARVKRAEHRQPNRDAYTARGSDGSDHDDHEAGVEAGYPIYEEGSRARHLTH